VTETTDRKLADSLAYPPRAMRAERAAAYVGMSTSQFLAMVRNGDMPKPLKVHKMTIWDRLDLDAAIENWKATPDEGADPGTFRAAVERWKSKSETDS